MPPSARSDPDPRPAASESRQGVLGFSTAAHTIQDQCPASSSRILPSSFASRADRGCSAWHPQEVNFFHRSEESVRKIADLLRGKGAKDVLGEHPDASVPDLDHARSLATRGWIYDTDVVLIPLEDGDRCDALVAMGKKVIAINHNPLSKTARKAMVSIVDNILRAVLNMATQVRRLSKLPRADLERMVQERQDQLEGQFREK